MSKIDGHIEIWKKKLLDTTKRNRAINFRQTRSSNISIISPNIDDFFKVVDGRQAEFANLFEEDEDDDIDIDETIFDDIDPDEDEFVLAQGIKLPKKDRYSKDELIPVIEKFNLRKKKSGNKNYFFSDLSRKRQKDVLNNLMKRTRLFMEENAINILYLAVGNLNWYESEESNVVIKSPLFLLPVTIHQQEFDAPYTLGFSETEILLNTSLIKLMDSEFNIDLNFEFNPDEEYYESYTAYKNYVLTKFHDKHWYIDDDINLTVFSFSKINMVKDLEANRKEIINNELLKMLSGDESKYTDEGRVYSEDELDSLIRPFEYFQALDADSSQELAIQSAITGKSFVLQGPPGTGKSQTITNIISELISRGKKVLFVAEKKAALDVVYSNLKKVGLEEYALPLHNQSVDKKTIIQELNHALVSRQSIRKIEETQLNLLDYKFTSSRETLSKYAQVLLQKLQPLNKSIYEIYGLFFKYYNSPNLKFIIEDIERIDFNRLREFELIINEFESSYKNIGFNQTSHTWYGLNLTHMSQQEREDLSDNIRRANDFTKDLLDFIKKQFTFIKVNDDFDISYVKDLLALIKLILNLRVYDKSVIFEYEKNNYYRISKKDIHDYQQLIDKKNKLSMLSDNIDALYDKDVLKLDIKFIDKVLSTNTNFFKRLFSSQYRKVKSQLLTYVKDKKTSYKEFVSSIKVMKEYLETEKDINSLVREITFDTYTLYEAKNIKQHLEILTQYYELYDFLNQKDYEFTIEFESIIKDAIANKNDFKEIEKTLTLLIEYFEEYTNRIDSVINLPLQSLRETKVKLQHYNKDFSSIGNFLNFNAAYQKGINNGLKDFFDTIVNSDVKDQLNEIFLRRFYFNIIDNYHSENQILLEFNSDTFDLYKNEFAESDKKLIQLSKYRIDELITKNTPNIDGIEGNNVEVLKLRREAQKSRKIMPIRKLFIEIPNLILRLKPCLMMSPLSVSSFLHSSAYKFDTVIFDEASQVKPESAVGAIYRAKQVIIVGDKEQLPPTNFFENIDSDDESDIDVDSFDSILDFSLGTLKPVSLKWHYRSKFEELIQTSNREIYRDLVTFPSRSQAGKREGIDFEKVHGVYVDRKNTTEAHKVVELLQEHFDQFKDTRSIGVVTFSEAQQKEVERVVYRFRKEHHEYENYFNADRPEPFFIKNIETVQGDERDTIIISIGYGPDPLNNISMNFGPLNKEGGYRRLNVAITRAKINLIVVSSISESDIDLNRTDKRGMKMLKKFLTFAEFGIDDKEDNLDYSASEDSPFELDVSDEIERMGYQVRKQIGSSGYKLDLAVVNPKDSSKYVLGIECDGATYHSSKSARDRDRLRQEVLENRGWRIHRIWSTDWFKNRSQEIKKLKEAIEISLKDQKETKVNQDLVSKPILVAVNKEKKTPNFEEFPELSLVSRKYRYTHQLEQLFKDLSPIHIDYVQKIVPPMYGRTRWTSVVENDFRIDFQLLKRRVPLEMKDGFIIYKDKPIQFRKATSDLNTRTFDKIHFEEIVDAYQRLLEVSGATKLEDLDDMVIELCGYKKSNADYVSISKKAINHMLKKDCISIVGDVIDLKQKEIEHDVDADLII